MSQFGFCGFDFQRTGDRIFFGGEWFSFLLSHSSPNPLLEIPEKRKSQLPDCNKRGGQKEFFAFLAEQNRNRLIRRESLNLTRGCEKTFRQAGNALGPGIPYLQRIPGGHRHISRGDGEKKTTSAYAGGQPRAGRRFPIPLFRGQFLHSIP